jgi:hypothetical protein
MYGEENWPEQLRQDKSLFYRHDKPNEPTKEGAHFYTQVHICLSFGSQQGPPMVPDEYNCKTSQVWQKDY